MPAQKGFTLVELLVTISIIAVLSVVGTVSFIGIRNRALDAKIKGDINAIKKAYEANYDPTANGGQGGYKPLADSQFASGKKPVQPNGSQYICRIGPNCSQDNSQGYRIDAPLSDGTTYKAISNQGTLPAEQLNSCDPAGGLNTNLVGYWKMDETDPWVSDCATYSILDTKGGNNGKICNEAGNAGNITQVTNNFGRVAKFTGDTVSKYRIDLGDQAVFEKTSFTISAWINWSGAACNYSTCDIFSKGQSGSKGYALRLRGPGTYNAALNINDSAYDANHPEYPYLRGGTSIVSNRWYHIVGTLSSSKTMKIYVDGNLDGEKTFITDLPAFSSEKAMIGNGYSTSATPYITPFLGMIDQVFFYDRVLSDDEINTLYKAGMCP